MWVWVRARCAVGLHLGFGHGANILVEDPQQPHLVRVRVRVGVKVGVEVRVGVSVRVGVRVRVRVRVGRQQLHTCEKCSRPSSECAALSAWPPLRAAWLPG